MAITGRPKKVRYVQRMPNIVQFSPRGKPGRPDEVELAICEFESIKLADYQGFSQAQGALAMKLSRASFGRIVRSARKKIANALVNGKAIKIRMGSTQIGVRKKDFTREDVVSKEVNRFAVRSRKVAEEVDKLVQKNKNGSEKISPGGSKIVVLK